MFEVVKDSGEVLERKHTKAIVAAYFLMCPKPKGTVFVTEFQYLKTILCSKQVVNTTWKKGCLHISGFQIMKQGQPSRVNLQH